MTRTSECRASEFLQCLAHQLPENQTSPIGLVCPLCKQRLYVRPPRGDCRGYWESQPAAYSLAGEPCFVHVLAWEDFHIRSLHPAGSDVDARRLRTDRRTVDDIEWESESRTWH